MKLLIKNARLVTGKTGVCPQRDVLIVDGIIREIGEGIKKDPEGCTLVDAQGRFLAPAFFDMHCHLREPGYEYKETIQSGAAAAFRGGFSQVCCMPNLNPVTDSADTARDVIKRACGAPADVHPIGAITRGLEGKELSPYEEMEGIAAVSDDGNPVADSSVMRRAMLECKKLGLAVISHCEDKALSANGVMNEGETSKRLGLPGIPKSAEEVMVAREVLLALETGAKVHIAHVSTRRSVELVRLGKRLGAELTAETCPHYFSLTERDVERAGVHAKVSPPLREETDRQAVIEGLSDGTIDVIATDHAPHAATDKPAGDMKKAANGFSGFETAFSVCVTYLLKPGYLNLHEIVGRLSDAPRRILGFKRVKVCVNEKAELVLLDTARTREIKSAAFLSRGKNSPFDGMTLCGDTPLCVNGGHVTISEEVLYVD